MDQMLALLPHDVPPNRLFLAVFLRRLPADMWNQLAAQDLEPPYAMSATLMLGPRGPFTLLTVGLPWGHRCSPGIQSQTPAAPWDDGGHEGCDGLCFYHTHFGHLALCSRPLCDGRKTANGSLSSGTPPPVRTTNTGPALSFLRMINTTQRGVPAGFTPPCNKIGFTTYKNFHTVQSLQSHCIHTQIHSLTGPVCQLFASHHQRPRHQWGTYVKPGSSC